jgi:hypothetical protein
MAITVIGGLVTSTLLSLLVVPPVFTYIDDFKKLPGWARVWSRRPVALEPLPHAHSVQTAGTTGAISMMRPTRSE